MRLAQAQGLPHTLLHTRFRFHNLPCPLTHGLLHYLHLDTRDRVREAFCVHTPWA